MTNRASLWAVLAAVVSLNLACNAEPSVKVDDFGKDASTLGGIQQVTGFGSNPGALNMYKYVPANMPSNAPLVVAMHGCTQRAADYAQIGWNELAEKHKFYVMYPEQTSANNGAYCFNWAGEYGDPTNIRRGEGENLSIKQMVDKMMADHSIDASRVFVTGFSGGGAQTALMLAVYPEVFVAGGILAGIPYNCTTTFSEVAGCLTPGKNRTAEQWGKLVRDAVPSHTGAYPRVAILQGTQDNLVSTSNRIELLEQWTNVHGIDMNADAAGTLDGYPHKQFKDAGGKTLVETLDITGMGHGAPIDSRNACGTAGSYRLDVGFCSSKYLADFFGLTGPVTDLHAPTVDIKTPANGATVSGQVTVQATVSDDVGVTRIEFYVDNVPAGTDTSAPWEFAWNTASVANGVHTLKAVAFDASGKSGTDDDISVTVSNAPGGDTTPPITSASPAGGNYAQAVTVTLTPNEPASTRYTVDGSAPTAQSLPYTGPISISASTTLRFFSVDTAGNAEAVRTEVYTIDIGGADRLASIAAEDGYVGKYYANGVSASTHKIGDAGSFNNDTWRTILSFDTSAIPEGATLNAVKLRVYRKSLTGKVNGIDVDIKSGFFGVSSSLSQSDFLAAASAASVASLSVPSTDGAFSEVVLPASALSHVNRSGLTQIRLRAQTPIDFASDVLELHGGEDVELAPVLVISY